YYNMVSASLISFKPDTKIFQQMITDITDGWDTIVGKYDSLKGKRGMSFYPEQEYLTGLFTGKWQNLPVGQYRTTTRTKYHYGSFPDKYWYSLYKLENCISKPCMNFFVKYPDTKDLFPTIYQKIKKSVINSLDPEQK